MPGIRVNGDSAKIYRHLGLVRPFSAATVANYIERKNKEHTGGAPFLPPKKSFGQFGVH
jgi:hypothetical protein